MLPPKPDGLEKLLSSRRSSFAVAWRAIEEPGELPQIARMLARADWPVEPIVAALMHHPIGPDEATCERIAQQAAQREAAARAEDERSELRLVAVVLTDPPLVDVAYGSASVRLAIAEVGSRAKLRAACLSAFLAAPKLPSPKTYDEWLTASLAAADKIDEVEDATEAATERHVMESIISGLPRCDNLRGVRQHRVWLQADDDGKTWAYLHQPSVLAEAVRPYHPGMSARRCCELLRDLGWKPTQIRDGDEIVRVWRGTRKIDAEFEALDAEVASLDEARNKRAASWQAADGGDNGW